MLLKLQKRNQKRLEKDKMLFFTSLRVRFLNRNYGSISRCSLMYFLTFGAPSIFYEFKIVVGFFALHQLFYRKCFNISRCFTRIEKSMLIVPYSIRINFL